MQRLSIIKQAISNQCKRQELTFTKLEITRKDEVGTIWMNSPKDLNALSVVMIKQILQALHELNHEKVIKVILLRSKVDKIFCAGANIKEFFSNDVSEYPHSINFRTIGSTIRQYLKPIIAVVEGKAFGGGFQIALLSDIILCSEKAQFGLPQITLGLIPGIGGTQILPRIVGQKIASKMILTGLPIDAKEAHRLNIAHLLPSENFEVKLNEIVTAISSKSMETILAAKKAIKISADTTLDQGMEHESSIFNGIFNKKGAKEGIQAFLDKRKPNFKGI